jgi:hypothetical protein
LGTDSSTSSSPFCSGQAMAVCRASLVLSSHRLISRQRIESLFGESMNGGGLNSCCEPSLRDHPFVPARCKTTQQ